ncbi:polysaccharide pyruvyl transferase family protein [Streptomyces lonarensis]|uniref:Polysaccharide pyruvyl transferase family protein n=1 Tax=Streptomyces lonarensis TaxID=700599 RepID=A0A7X6HYG1_9ACTN|nr:polysaccharide pyruvyl transferase family protein [Streptomyces lonarensis]NJQ05581.1 polysaccharide pyruvyl transferase family protein [Streptomyces lonarensis]
MNALASRLDRLLQPRSTRSRILLAGWFSFLDGEVTAGDALAERAVRTALDRIGLAHDTAWSPGFVPGGPSLDRVRPRDYEHLLFVCGPVHGRQVAELHQQFAHCRRTAVGVSVVDRSDPAVRGFHRVVARDGFGGVPLPDLAAQAPALPGPPVVGVALTHGQGEYAGRRLHDEVAGLLLPWLAAQDCARVEADTRLAHRDWRHSATPDAYLALLRRLDLVVTDRLHGLALALRVGVPAVAVDPVRGGAKVSAQARVLRWPALLAGESFSEERLDHWWRWCLSSAGRAAAGRRARLLARSRSE